MARRHWREQDHPRHPGESPGGVGGRFREKVGGSGWAARLNSMLGGRRGATEYQVGRAGGRSDLGDTSDGELRQAIAESDADYARGIEPRAGSFIGNVPSTHGNARPRPEPTEDQRQMDEGGNLPRLTGQEVAQALAPQRDRAVHDEYNRHILGEALDVMTENEGPLGYEDDDDVPDEELNAQFRAAVAARDRGDWAAYDEAVDHLRRMLTISYLDEEDLPDLPPGRRSGTSGV